MAVNDNSPICARYSSRQMITSFIIHDLRLQSAKGFSATASWGNVIQMADLFFNGMYPYIDPGTGRKNQRHDCRRRQ
jgi:hypothetical protein